MSQRGITQIGKYQIVDQVGEGAMGVVYRATDPVLNRTVAVKVMCDAIARDDDLRGRFLREAQATGSLQHPNVITIYDFGEFDGHLYIAMEFVEGEDLEDLLAKHIPLSVIDKLDIVIDVLGALAYAHKRGIVHRDVKPANIRIDEDGRARVMDFGIAHLSSSNMTRTGVMVGTPAYMAPEQIVGGGIGPPTDLFSAGTVLYELLSGSKPFQGESIQATMYQIVSQPAAPLNTATLGIPAALDAIVQRALAKDVKDRYGSALEMANALTEVRAGLDRAAAGSKTVSLRSVIDMGLTAERAAKQRDAKRHAALTAVSAAGAVVVFGLLGFLVMRGKASPSTELAGTPTALAQAPNNTGVPPSPAGATRAANSLASPSVTDSAFGKTSITSTPATAPSTTNPPKKGANAPSSEELLLVRTLQTTALDGRRRAIDAGATAEQLRAGDDRNRAADALIAQGRVGAAAIEVKEATVAWDSAERAARLNASVADRTRSAPADSPKLNLPPVPVSAPTVGPPQTAPARPPVVAVNPAAEIESAVVAYAKAIESRDINEVRRAYPGITAAQASGFEQFFASVRSLKAAFSLSSLDVNGATADGKLTGTYDYLTGNGKSERQAVSFQASFRRDGAGWKLASVR
jgi:eukaryotic-like serine/threonine-protein kinase